MKKPNLKEILTFEKIDGGKLTNEENNTLLQALKVFKNEKRFLLYYYLITFLSIQSVNPSGGFPVAKKIVLLLEGSK